MASEDRRGWQALGTRLSRTNGSQRLAGSVGSAQHHIQVTVLTRHDGHLQGATAIEVVQHELAVLIAASEHSGIAVDAKDRGRDLGTVLAHDEPPCVFALRTLVGKPSVRDAMQ